REPDTFFATYESEASKPMSFFAKRLAASVVFGAFDGAGIVGMAGFYRPQGRGTLWGMYVRKSARRSGAGRALVHAVIAYAAKRTDALQLIVSAGNSGAVRFYKALGFAEAGSAPDSAMRHGDEIVMRMELSR